MENTHVNVREDARLTAILCAEIFRMASSLVPAIPCRLVGKGWEEINKEPANQSLEGKFNTCTTFNLSIVDLDFRNIRKFHCLYLSKLQITYLCHNVLPGNYIKL